jgi:hypothetical protein
MMIMPELRSSIDMMRYTINNPTVFDNGKITLPFVLSFLKFFAALNTELLNIFKMGEANNIDDVVKDFIAFGIIAEIDNFIVLTVNSVHGKAVCDYIEENEINYDEAQYSLGFREYRIGIWKKLN